MSVAVRLYRAVAAGMVMASSVPAACASAPARSVPSRQSLAAIIDEAAQRFSIPRVWIDAVMRVESGANPRALSPKGAAGLMQIMPATWNALRVRHNLGNDIFDVRDNVMAGAAYLRELHDLYGSPGFLAAYNAGPGRYEEYLSDGHPLPAETTAYVGKLAPLIGAAVPAGAPRAASDPNAWTRAGVFAGRSAIAADRGSIASEPGPPAPDTASPGRPAPTSFAGRADLFIPLSGASPR